MTLAEIEKTIEDEFKRLFDEDLAPVMTAEFVNGVVNTDKALGVTFSTFQTDEIAAQFVADYKTPFFKDLSGTTKKYLFDAIKTTIDEGGTAYDLWRKIEGNKAFTPTRAELIWRTEMSRAFNEGTDARAKDLGVERGYIECGGDPCEECAGWCNKEMRWEDLPALPRHPRCECVKIPLPRER